MVDHPAPYTTSFCSSTSSPGFSCWRWSSCTPPSPSGYAKEHLDDLPTDPSWVGIGFGVADAGLVFLLIATITAGVASRRALAAGADTTGAPRVVGVRVATSLCALMLVAYVVAVWAMTAKPV